MKKAVIYTRVSTEEQAKHDLSLPFQKDKCNEYAKKNGYTVIEEFEDAGKSARTANRPDLLRMLNYISNNKIDAVIVHKSDRLSRDMADFWTMRRMFKEKNIKLLSVSENFDDSNPSSEFLMGIMSAQAQFYSANLGHEVKKGIMQKVKNGWWPNNAPLGYENYGAKHDRKIRPREDARKHIVRAFKLFSTGEYSISSLSDELRDSGFKSNNGQLVSRSKIGKMLKNPIYYGEFLWKEELYKDKHEPLISKELFYSVQTILKNRCTKCTRDRKHNFMLRGYVFCTCGSMLTGELKKKKFKNGKQQTYFYFGCKNTKKKKECSRVYIRMEELETMVADIFKEVEFEDIFKDEIMKEAKNIIQEVRETETEEKTAIKQNIAKIETRMANAEDDRMDRIINHEEFARIYERFKIDLAKEQKKLAQLESGHDKVVTILSELLRLTENIYATYTSAPDEIKRQYLNLFIDRVKVDNKEIVSVKLTPIVEQLVEINRVRISDNWREAWDDFRTSNWVNIIKYPESFIQQGVQLLSVVNVQI